MDWSDNSIPNDGSSGTGLIVEPTDTDVLLGRGVSTNRHPGNVNFRSIVSEHVVSSLCFRFVLSCSVHNPCGILQRIFCTADMNIFDLQTYFVLLVAAL